MKAVAVLALVIAAAASACGCAAERRLSDAPPSDAPAAPSTNTTPASNDTPPTPPKPTPPTPAAPVTPKYRVVEKMKGVELRRYKHSTWITMPVASHDFHFTTEISYEDLLAYFDGDNFAEEKVPLSTPLRLQFNLWDLRAQRYVSFYVPADKPPAPKYPLFLNEADEAYVYAIPYNETYDFGTIARYVADALVDLVEADEPVDGSCDGQDIFLDMYSYPKNTSAKSRPNEILITRVKTDDFKKFSSAMTEKLESPEAPLPVKEVLPNTMIVAS